MIGRTVGAVLSACVAVVVAGCATVPAPPQEVSVVLPKDAAIYGEDPAACDEADTLIVAQCRQMTEYHSVVKGNRVQRWYLTDWRVIRAERGQWRDEAMNFVFHDSDSPSGAGFYLGERPSVYYKGAVVAFCVDTSKSPPVIVAQQTRSRLPSHGSLRRPKYDIRVAGREQVFQNVTKAARQFVQLPFGGGSLAVTEEYDAFFVVEVMTADDSIALMVEKNSYRVTQLPNAYVEVEQPDAGV